MDDDIRPLVLLFCNASSSVYTWKIFWRVKLSAHLSNGLLGRKHHAYMQLHSFRVWKQHSAVSRVRHFQILAAMRGLCLCYLYLCVHDLPFYKVVHHSEDNAHNFIIAARRKYRLPGVVISYWRYFRDLLRARRGFVLHKLDVRKDTSSTGRSSKRNRSMDVSSRSVPDVLFAILDFRQLFNESIPCNKR